MKKLFYHIGLILVVIATICALGVSVGCSQPNHEGFAIYLTQDNISVDKMPALNLIKIANTPLIELSDIVSYNSSTYQLTLTADASNRISNLVVTTSGLPFVVCVDRKPVYWGDFWSEPSSAFVPTSCVIVSYPLSHSVQTNPASAPQIDPHILELDYNGNNDPRNNPEILQSLEQAGKLITSATTSITSTTTTISSNSNSTSSNSISGLSLSLSLDGMTYQPGQEVSISVDEKNTLSTINNVTATDNLPSEFMSGFTNDPSPLPFGLAVLQGNYTVSNYSAMTPLIIYDPSKVYIGTQVVGPTSYAFQPLSDTAVLEGGSYNFIDGVKLQYEIGINSYWPNDASTTSTNFEPGVYTVVAGDEWGALVVVHFTVSS
jgi:hypothetical protein